MKRPDEPTRRKINIVGTRLTLRKFEAALDKLMIKDEHGAEVAYAFNGTIFVILDGRRIASLRGGNVYGTNGQMLGRLAPKGAVMREDGTMSEAFLRLVAR